MWKDWQGIEQREGSETVHQERDALLFVLLSLGEQGEEPRSVPSESITHQEMSYSGSQEALPHGLYAFKSLICRIPS